MDTAAPTQHSRIHAHGDIDAAANACGGSNQPVASQQRAETKGIPLLTSPLTFFFLVHTVQRTRH